MKFNKLFYTTLATLSLTLYTPNTFCMLGDGAAAANATDIPSIETKIVTNDAGDHQLIAISSTTGLRSEQEDTYAVNSNDNLFGVFDGHGGNFVSNFLKKHLFKNILMSFENDHKAAINNGFLDTNREILKLFNGYQGSTAITAWILGRRLLVANVGDSRAVLCKTSGELVALSRDHKVCDIEEEVRINMLNGDIIMNDVPHGEISESNRLWLSQSNTLLAISRSFGHNIEREETLEILKPNPEITEHHITPEDAFLILASDGLWDTLSNEDAVAIVLAQGGNLNDASIALVQEALRNGSRDNITAMIINLQELIQRTITQ